MPQAKPVMSSEELHANYYVPEGKEIFFDEYNRPYHKDNGKMMLSRKCLN